MRLRTILISVPVLGVALAILPSCDAWTRGPYSTWFNNRCQRLADQAKLVGRPEGDVVKVLGPPAYFYPGDDDNHRTYNYVVPFSMPRTSKFQVHCHDGVVTGVEQFDD
jgi:hypothetical protein